MNARTIMLWSSVAFAAATAACGGESASVNPAPTGAPSGGTGGADGSADSDTGGTGGSAGAPGTGGVDAGPAVRTIITRDVFENLDDPDNLMLDGGFEFTGDSSFTWGSVDQAVMGMGNGAMCRTGLRCARIPGSSAIYGMFVTPASGSMDLVIHTTPAGTNCATYSAMVFDLYSQNGVKQLLFKSRELGADGWCEGKATIAAAPYTVPALYLESTVGDLLVDDVVIRAVPARASSGTEKEPAVPDALRTRVQEAREHAYARLWHHADQRLGPRRGAPWTARFPAWIR